MALSIGSKGASSWATRRIGNKPLANAASAPILLLSTDAPMPKPNANKSAAAEFVPGGFAAFVEPVHDRVVLRQQLGDEDRGVDDPIG
jgi:hypothetical protein